MNHLIIEADRKIVNAVLKESELKRGLKEAQDKVTRLERTRANLIKWYCPTPSYLEHITEALQDATKALEEAEKRYAEARKDTEVAMRNYSELRKAEINVK